MLRYTRLVGTWQSERTVRVLVGLSYRIGFDPTLNAFAKYRNSTSAASQLFIPIHTRIAFSAYNRFYVGMVRVITRTTPITSIIYRDMSI